MWDTLIHRFLRVPYRLHAVAHGRAARGQATVVFLHGIGSSYKMWDPVISNLPHTTPTLAIDLLGFGKSPRPSWSTYDTRSHAACVVATLRAHCINGPVVLVGHSLGSLIAIDVARKRPWQVQSLLLVSPPFYQAKFVRKRLSRAPEEFVRKLYKMMRNNPKRAERLLKLATRNRMFNKGFDADSLSVDSYLASLSSAILNQNSFHTIQQLEQPVHIITGKL
ncbi:hypothetical protein CR970_00515, partial [Candidatus Saccharibacteria bacterium]